MTQELEKWKSIFELKLKQDNIAYNELHGILVTMKDSGLDRGSALSVLTELRNSMKLSLTETKDDLILELIDIVNGWCAPRNRIW